MKNIITLLFALTLSVAAQTLPPGTNATPADEFSLVYFGTPLGGGFWYATNFTDGTFNFPTNGVRSYPAFAVKTNASPIDISGAALLIVTFQVNQLENTYYRYGGQGVYNTGPMPPHARMFFSTRYNYDNEDGCPKCSWWNSDAWQSITNGVFTLTANLDPLKWSDSGARLRTSAPPTTLTFQDALTNVAQIGVSFGGGSFYDTGLAVTAGQSTFTLISVRVIKPVRVAVEYSSDLTNWGGVSEFMMLPTNASSFYRFNIGN